jgi:ubiquitin C-terminal hydrolase
MQNPVIVGSSTTNNYLRNVSRLKNSFKLFGFDCDVGFFNDAEYIGENLKGKDVLLYNNLVRTGVTTKLHVKQLK